MIIILGIDPGYARLGYGLIGYDQGRGQTQNLGFGLIESKGSQSHAYRLLHLRKIFRQLLTEKKPHILSIEKLFFFKNQKTAFQVAESRGVILAEAADFKLEIVEYTPLQIKMAMTGSGRASKGEIQQMVKILCNLQEIPKPDDCADGLAAALTHSHFIPFLNSVKESNSTTN